MGNKLGGQKSSKSKDEKRRDKEIATKREKEEEKLKKKTTKKEKKENKSKKKEKAKKADSKTKHASGRDEGHDLDSEFDTDRESSSHVTGWDSESGVFHSAENISTSPYLDSHTRSELEHSGTWSALYESSSAARHPQVLSSRDFRDGFSLEACIPPEIARRDTSNFYDPDGRTSVGGGGGGGGSGGRLSYSNSGSLKSKRSNSTKSSSRMTPTSARYQADDVMSVSTSSSQRSGGGGAYGGREGYSTPLLTTPVFGRADRSYSPIAASPPGGATSALARVHEADNDLMDMASLARSPYDPNAKVYTTYNPPAHLAHIYQHQHQHHHQQQQQQQQPPQATIDYRNLPKPTSPYPQRRALSPKMMSPSFKLISSDDSSSSPSTPIPQRKNILAELLRAGRGSSEKKRQQKAKAGTSESDDNGTCSHRLSSNLAEEGERKKSKGLSMWKTWERSTKKKSEKSSKISIFGTSRKTNKKNEKRDKHESLQDEDKVFKQSKNTDRMSDSTLKDVYIGTQADAFRDKANKSATNNPDRLHVKTTKSSTSSYDTSDVDYWGDKNRNSSPPVARTAAFCIMRLEELERNIEKTIREKFPDAEPFLIRKRTPPDDSSRGSKSLPTTPSPKKKVYITHDTTDQSQKEAVTSTLKAASNKLGSVTGTTHYYDETFEESVSPMMSPVILRRFGARTRHASISPKIQRAKTAALYNSPSEMERVSECLTPARLESPPNEPSDQFNRSPMSVTGHSTSSPSPSQSSQCYSHQLVRQRRIEIVESDEDAPLKQQWQPKDLDSRPTQITAVDKQRNGNDVDTHSFDKPVIVPSFSAVFGSVSPKLKRHLRAKLDTQGLNRGARSFDHAGSDTQRIGNNETSGGKGAPLSQRSESLDTTFKNSRVEKGRETRAARSTIEQRKDNQMPPARRPSNIISTTNSSSSQTVTSSSPSVQTRVANIVKTMSEGWAGSGEGSGGYPSPSHARNSEKMRPATSTTVTSSASSSPCSTPAWPNSNLHLRCADTMQQDGEAKRGARGSHKTSPGTGRKHSTDHVIFGSAVALPCRLYSSSTSPPSSPERRKGTNNNNTFSTSHFDSTSNTHAQTGARGVHHEERNVKRCEGSQADVGANTPATQQSGAHDGSTSCKESTNLSDPPVGYSRAVTKDNVPISVRQRGGSDISKSSSTANATSSQRRKNAKVVYHSDAVSHSRVSDDDTKQLSLSTSSSRDERKTDGHRKEILKRPSPGTSSSNVRRVGQFGEKIIEEEQPVIVLKQPVSKVISDMINSSKQHREHQQPQRQQQQREQQRQQQQQKQHQQQQQQQQRNWQASPTTPEKDAMHVEPAVAMVTTPSFQQACLSLEEKCVVDGSRFAPSSGDYIGSKEDESSKETGECSVSKTEVRTHSSGKGGSGAKGKSSDSNDSGGNAHTSSETSEGSDLDRFLKSVKASEKIISSNTKATTAASDLSELDQNPPPPSPTAVEKVSEILEEEEEEEEEEEDEAAVEAIRQDSQPMVNLALVRQNEMRAFSDEVCQRLSDLLSSHTGSDDVFVGTDGKEDDDKEEVEKEEMSKENMNVEEIVPGYRDDLHEHWEDPGLLSEPSEDPAGETITSGKPISENALLSELMRRSRFSTSSSLSTSTSSSSSSSGLFAPPSLPPSGKRNVEGTFKGKQHPHEYFAYHKQDEDDDDLFDGDSHNRQDAHMRTYHSDDDVARGGAIPDYYDDRPLWKKRQKPPGQISIAMAAIRRRERRERWLKKRRRNRTDLISTGSSDNVGSDASLKPVSRRSFGDSTASCEYEEDEEVASALQSHRRAMGSGILSSPKYSKPIMPFWGSGDVNAINAEREAKEDVIIPRTIESRLTASRHRRGDDNDDDDDEDVDDCDDNILDDSCDKDSSTISRSTDHTLCEEHSQSFDTTDELDDHRASLTTTSTERMTTPPTIATTSSSTGSHSHTTAATATTIIPGLEETFDELLSVQQILEELQDRTPTTTTAGSSQSQQRRQHSDISSSSNNSGNRTSGKCMPLTVENIKSIKEMYKDANSGRRSRLSNTDRTESDLDLFSEYRDDASTDSNLYADDEDDDDNNEPYATADDDVTGATGGDDDVENFVVGCTFYNSKSTPPSEFLNGNSNNGRQRSFENNRSGAPPTVLTPTEASTSVTPTNNGHRNNTSTNNNGNNGNNHNGNNNNNNGNNNNGNNNNNNNGDNHQLLLVRSPPGAGYVRSNSAPGSRSESGHQFSISREASAAGFNSDEEFWAGRAAFERSYQQLESAAGAVSSTFQNAREQMMDIQQHLQALRRQMEGLQDDLTSTSYTLTPDFSAFDSK